MQVFFTYKGAAMNIIGIVCEYNPIHNGHIYQIEQTKKQLPGGSMVVCVMSGDYVQRGEPAMFSKFARAEAACRSGADLVVELPLPWCIASAEGFAKAGVTILDALHCQYISFGSESGEISELETIADELLSDEFVAAVKARLALAPNMSFAAARQQVLEERLGSTGKLIELPNNILAVEYLKAIRQLNSTIKPMTVKRKGSGHDEHGNEEIKSASELRQMLLSGKQVNDWLPEWALAVYNREIQQGRASLRPQTLELCILSRLRMLDEQSFENLPDAADGVGKRLYKACMEQPTLDSIVAAAKNKRIAHSRLRRMCLAAALGVDKTMLEQQPPYIRVLAANAVGRAYLRQIDGETALPIVTKPAAVRQMSQFAGQVFAVGASAHDLFTLQYIQNEDKRGGSDWRTGPQIV
jgi:predicted nucleotidyltransferase